MSGHTPGPWKADTFMVMGGEGSRDRICHVGTTTSLGPARSYETLANAALIAAAPELLEALRYSRRWLKPEDHDVAFVDAIIAKAEGRP